MTDGSCPAVRCTWFVNYGLPDRYLSEYAGNMRRLSEENLAAAARAVVRPEELVWLVVGDLARI